jgi:hypothetical protein
MRKRYWQSPISGCQRSSVRSPEASYGGMFVFVHLAEHSRFLPLGIRSVLDMVPSEFVAMAD